MQEPLIAALAAAGVPSAAAGTPLMQSFCVGETLGVAAARMGYLTTGVQSAIAADAPRILRVLLEARLAEFGSAVGFPSRYQTYGDGAPVQCAIHIDDVLAILAPEAPDATD